jgi:hypothetical protein
VLDYTRIEANLPIAKIIDGNQAMNSVETQAFVWNIDMMKFHYEHHIENSAIRRNLDITHSYVENNLSHHKNIEHYSFNIVQQKGKMVLLYNDKKIAEHLIGFFEFVCKQTAQGLILNDDLIKNTYFSYKLECDMVEKPSSTRFKI